jgi:hypothetical protein
METLCGECAMLAQEQAALLLRDEVKLFKFSSVCNIFS